MRVDLRGEDALVAEQLLHLPDAGPALEQVGSERVPEGVRRYLLLDAGPAGRLAEDREDHDAREAAAAVVEEERLLPGPCAAPHLEVAVDPLPGRRTDRDESLLVALAGDADVTLAEEEVPDAERGELRDAQAARVEHLEHRGVADLLGGRSVHGGDDAVDLPGREHVGQVPPELRRQDEFGRRTFDAVADEQEVEETLHAAQRPGLRGLFPAAVVEPCDVALHHGLLDLRRRHVVHAQDEVSERPQVAHVGLHGVLRQPLLEFDVGPVVPAGLFPFFRIFRHSESVESG